MNATKTFTARKMNARLSDPAIIDDILDENLLSMPEYRLRALINTTQSEKCRIIALDILVCLSLSEITQY
jgi:hypothetical protein